ncbi:hypothetical protein [Polycladidibacter stylochi]|uniref:hypothetical protein n=1 Tax=Polycladidibacter stylochi TaxID=1807766 RepID=UPI0008325D61|nr:hypothetical protein [Pseudovibrio stylochi]
MEQSQWTNLVVRLARSWIGTPYRHQASKYQVGCDCLGLVRGIYRKLYGDEPQAVPPYNMYWAEAAKEGHDPLKEAAQKYLMPISTPAITPAQVLLFRWNMTSPCKHLGIATSKDAFVHAYEAAGTVESPLIGVWKKKIAARFLFPMP